MKIPYKKVKGKRPSNGQNLVIFNIFWAKFVVFPPKWHVFAEILDILRKFKAENKKKLRK